MSLMYVKENRPTFKLIYESTAYVWALKINKLQSLQKSKIILTYTLHTPKYLRYLIFCAIFIFCKDFHASILGIASNLL